MTSEADSNVSMREGWPEPEMPGGLFAAGEAVERGAAVDAFRAFDDGVLAEVPYALDAYMAHQCFDLI